MNDTQVIIGGQANNVVFFDCQHRGQIEGPFSIEHKGKQDQMFINFTSKDFCPPFLKEGFVDFESFSETKKRKYVFWKGKVIYAQITTSLLKL
ncbi:hypothetical protein Dip510_001622 [Elusimicrobium posterum]|uniref:hypothetical protein n=1 Tax=Elusimicrobium posterum TaxID=3116653 RepID=UPI003C71C77C